MVVVDFPQASVCNELILDTQIANRSQQVTVFTIVQAMLSNTEIHMEFDGRIPVSDQMTLVAGVYEVVSHLKHALHPLLKQSTFELIATGAEIDEISETLWLWLDDPDDPT